VATDALTLDQVQVFLAVCEHGSFSAAAKALHRGQSVVTYQVQKLEEQVGVTLFDRREYRPALTEAGRAMLPRAQHIAAAVGQFRTQARALAGGLEPELRLAVSAIFPIPTVIAALRAFSARYPTVSPRIYVESFGGAARLVSERICDLGIILGAGAVPETLEHVSLFDVRLVVVASPNHPLALLAGPLPPATLRDHVQLVVTARPGEASTTRDIGVYAAQTWRIADLAAKHDMLRAGLGWGSMPLHMVEEDLRAGRLVRLVPTEWDGARRDPALPANLAFRRDDALGPATQWMRDHLVQITHQAQG
jgi:DNA-binding transcriptional LysR family regulator